jgi:hypothetical protein
MATYWFRPRRYGYGAAPVTWQGWVLSLGVAAVIALSVVAMNLLVERSNFSLWILWAAIIAAVVFWFVRICRQRTDGEWRWRWNAPRADR